MLSGAFPASSSAADIAQGRVAGVQLLQGYREQVKVETARWARVPPRFSADGRVALFTIHSESQLHPLIATRWVRRLRSTDKKRQLVMVRWDCSMHPAAYVPVHSSLLGKSSRPLRTLIR